MATLLDTTLAKPTLFGDETASPNPNPPKPVAAGPVTGGTALDKALAIQGAARANIAGDPLAQRAVTAMSEADAGNKAAAAAIEANVAAQQKLLSEDTPRPSIPRLEPLPKPPVEEPKDPMRVFGQFLPILAALGGLATHTPAVASLNAATAAVNAAKAKDKEALERHHEEWLDALRTTIQNNNQSVAEYRMVLDDHNASVTEKQAKLTTLASMNRDQVVLAALKSGNLDGITKLLQVQGAAAAQLGNLVTAAEQSDLERYRTQVQEAQGWARLAIEQINAGKLSPGEAIAPIIRKVASGDPPTKAELAALETYKQTVGAQQSQFFPGGGASLPGGSVNAGQMAQPAPTNAAAVPVTAAPVAKPATAAPVAAMAAPQNPKDRKIGTVYGTPKGDLIWTGTGWKTPGG